MQDAHACRAVDPATSAGLVQLSECSVHMCTIVVEIGHLTHGKGGEGGGIPGDCTGGVDGGSKGDGGGLGGEGGGWGATIWL